MEIKIKHIMIVIVIFIIGIFSLIINRRKNGNISQNFENSNLGKSYDVIGTDISDYLELTKIYNPDYLKGGEGSIIIGYILAKKNVNWDKYPLSEKFKEKYNEKDGILGKLQYDDIEYRAYAGSIEKYYFRDYYTYFVITQGLEQTAYIYDTVYQQDGYLLDDVTIIEKIKITDSEGNYLSIKGHSIDRDNFYSCFNSLSRGGDDEQSIAVTDHFHKKYPYFLDLFIHYSPLRFNRIEFIPERSSWEKKEAYFIVDSKLECKKRYYRVKFKLDDKGYLDDVNVIKVNEVEYEGDNQYETEKLTYKNSNWSGLKLSDKFKNKYNSNTGILNDIDSINIDIQMDGITVERSKVYIREFIDKNGQKVIYSYQYFDKDGELDDIVCKRMNYYYNSLEEAKELYLKDLENIN